MNELTVTENIVNDIGLICYTSKNDDPVFKCPRTNGLDAVTGNCWYQFNVQHQTFDGINLEHCANIIFKLHNLKVYPTFMKPNFILLKPKYNIRAGYIRDLKGEFMLFELKLSAALLALLREKRDEYRELLQYWEFELICKFLSHASDLEKTSQGNITFEESVDNLFESVQHILKENPPIKNYCTLPFRRKF